MFTKINHNLRLSQRAILDLITATKIPPSALAIDAQKLEKMYTAAEAIDPKYLPVENTDIIVVLSGRGDFYGKYSETGDKYALSPNSFDSFDTINRIKYGIDIAKKCTKNNQRNGEEKPVYIYFNGVDRQNEQLKELLKTHGAFHGYPAHLFIIESCPLGSTAGQVLGVGRFLEQWWPLYRQHWQLNRDPNLLIISNSYHVPRSMLAFGCNSPLLTAQFWHNRPALLEKLDKTMHDYALAQGNILKNSSIMGIGFDRQITDNPSWEKDLFGDMQAVVNYSSCHPLNFFQPSIAATVAKNIVTEFKISIKRDLGCRLFVQHTKQSDKDDRDESKALVCI